jgi:hypothetical protein
MSAQAEGSVVRDREIMSTQAEGFVVRDRETTT